MTKGACSKKKKALYVNHLSFLGVMWKHARQCKESQACCWYEKALTPDWAAVPLSICLSETERKREGWADWQMTKKRMKERRVAYVVRREKMERERRLETHTLGGDRCLEATLKTEGWGGGEPKRKMKQTPAECPSLTPLRSCEHSGTDWASHILSILLHFSYIFLHFLLHINRLTYNLHTYHTLAIPHRPYLSTLLTLSLSLAH